jgi:hypothetical protein
MRCVPIVTILLVGILGALAPRPVNAEVFSDDFDRADGPLGPPWELLDQSLLYIENQRAVAHANEYGLMLYGEQCPDCYCDAVTVLSTFNFSTNTDYDGRFQYFIGGGEVGGDYWGFNAKLGLDEVSLYSIDDENGEIELATVPSPLQHDFNHAMAFYYDVDAQAVSLKVYGAVQVVVDLTVPAASNPFCFLAMGIENLDATGDEGSIGAVTFEYCCDTTGVTGHRANPPLVAWPQPFTTRVNLRAAAAAADSRVEIFDVAGRRVGALRLQSGRGSWEARDLPAGVYLARVADAAGSQPLKLIKMR